MTENTITRRVTKHGVVVVLYPADATYWMQVEFAREVAGAPDEAGIEVLARVAPSRNYHTHEMPPTTEFGYYRARHVRDGYEDGDPTAWIRARPQPLPENIPNLVALAPAAPLIDFDLIVDKATGAVTISVNGEPSVKSIRWAYSLAAWPTEAAIAAGMVANTDINGDVEVANAFTIGPGQQAYVAVRFFASTGGTGQVVGTLRHSVDYDSIFEGDDPLHPWSMNGTFLELPRIFWKIPTGHTGLHALELRVGGTDWASATSVWEGLAEEYTASIDDVGAGKPYQSRSLTFRLGAHYLNGSFAEVDSVTVSNPLPNPDASTITATHRGGTVNVRWESYGACSATRLRIHASIQPGFIPSNATVVAGGDGTPGKWQQLLNFIVGRSFAVPPLDTLPPHAPIVLDGTQTLYIRVEMWDELTEGLLEPSQFSDELQLPLSQIPSSDVEAPGDSGELASLSVRFFAGKLEVKAQFASWPVGGWLVLRKDPFNTSDASWNAFTQATKISFWDSATEIGRTTSGDWNSNSFVTGRTYSVIGRTLGPDGTYGDVLFHGYVEDPVPTPNALTIAVISNGREITVEVPTIEAGNANWYRLHASTTPGFTPSEATVVTQTESSALARLAGQIRSYAAGKWALKYLAPSSIAFGTTLYFKLEARDNLTAILNELPVYSNQFTHVLSQIPGEAVFSLEPGPPTNNPVPTGLAIRPNTDGSFDWQLQFNYTQGAKKADTIVVYSKNGELTAPTEINDAVTIAAPTAASLQALRHEIKGIDGLKLWSFGVAAARRTINGLEHGPIQSPSISPDWTGRQGGSGDYSQLVSGTAAVDVKDGSTRGRLGLDVDGDLVGDIFGPTDLIGDGKLYVGLGGAMFVGTGSSPTARTKVLRIPHSALSPMDDTQQYSQSFAGDVRPGLLGVTCDLRYPLALPPGVTITAVRFHCFRNDASDQCTFDIYRTTTSGSSTSLASGGATTTGWQTRVFAFSEHVASTDNFSIHVQLLGVGVAADARLQYVEVEYTMPQYEFSI